MPTTLQAVLILVLFITPGFIAAGVIRRTVSAAFLATQNVAITAGLLGVLVHFIALPATLQILDEVRSLYLILDGKIESGGVSLLAYVWLFGVLFVLPVIIAKMITTVWRSKWAQPVLSSIGYSLVNLTPHAWDWFFLTQQRGCWVIAEMVDGSRVGGVFGTESFASLSPDAPDLYLEEVYSVDDEHNFGEVRPYPIGAWLNGSQIKALHFYRVDT